MGSHVHYRPSRSVFFFHYVLPTTWILAEWEMCSFYLHFSAQQKGGALSIGRKATCVPFPVNCPCPLPIFLLEFWPFLPVSKNNVYVRFLLFWYNRNANYTFLVGICFSFILLCHAWIKVFVWLNITDFSFITNAFCFRVGRAFATLPILT